MNTDLIIERIKSFPEETQKSAVIEALKQAYLNDFFLFSKYCLNYKDITWATHGEAIEVFESLAKRKLVVLPRGTFKSTLGCVAYPIWSLLKDPDKTILLDSEIYNNSKNFLREIRAHFKSANFQRVFGDLVGSRWGESEIIISSRKRNRKEASITVGGIGTVKVGQHYDLIIGDDYNSPKNSETPEKCQKVIDHVRYNLNILNPGGEYCFIGTRYAELDISGWILGDILNEKHLRDGKMLLFTEEKSGGLDDFTV